eukprot:CAMPEP_0194285490 /NCGR_PEP_ID=MMETSP0169-20130528/30307_1 /TAXON_ID=218684 /ORGANISM="Corethron pennatum, Strain L29A3" /LENGTH=30 /DNA_ID= /DNA_START= /DNA_END= /DNA_ORIENTATION=
MSSQVSPKPSIFIPDGATIPPSWMMNCTCP